MFGYLDDWDDCVMIVFGLVLISGMIVGVYCLLFIVLCLIRMRLVMI